MKLIFMGFIWIGIYEYIVISYIILIYFTS
jgi:hypothetical protein